MKNSTPVSQLSANPTRQIGHLPKQYELGTRMCPSSGYKFLSYPAGVEGGAVGDLDAE